MYKRINRSADRRRYQPAIHSDQIHELWVVAQSKRQPMTRVLSDAIEMYLDAIQEQDEEGARR